MREIRVNGYKRISKPKARRLFNDGADVYILPHKIMPGGLWYEPFNMRESLDDHRKDFDEIGSRYTYYNCMAETGHYVSFYVKENEDAN